MTTSSLKSRTEQVIKPKHPKGCQGQDDNLPSDDGKSKPKGANTMIIKLNDVHSLTVNYNKEYNCYDVELIEYCKTRVIKLRPERYTKEALEEEYGITL